MSHMCQSSSVIEMTALIEQFLAFWFLRKVYKHILRATQNYTFRHNPLSVSSIWADGTFHLLFIFEYFIILYCISNVTCRLQNSTFRLCHSHQTPKLHSTRIYSANIVHMLHTHTQLDSYTETSNYVCLTFWYWNTSASVRSGSHVIFDIVASLRHYCVWRTPFVYVLFVWPLSSAE